MRKEKKKTKKTIINTQIDDDHHVVYKKNEWTEMDIIEFCIDNYACSIRIFQSSSSSKKKYFTRISYLYIESINQSID